LGAGGIDRLVAAFGSNGTRERSVNDLTEQVPSKKGHAFVVQLTVVVIGFVGESKALLKPIQGRARRFYLRDLKGVFRRGRAEYQDSQSGFP